jgi:hypothetical protein
VRYQSLNDDLDETTKSVFSESFDGIDWLNSLDGYKSSCSYIDFSPFRHITQSHSTFNLFILIVSIPDIKGLRIRRVWLFEIKFFFKRGVDVDFDER